MKLCDLNLLFLAKFAPESGSEYPLITTETDGIYAQYHYDIYKILKQLCPKTSCLRSIDDFIEQKKQYDFVFTLLNRADYRNSEIFVSALFEYMKIPYLGARPNVRALAEDKHLAKMAAKYVGINTPEWIIINAEDNEIIRPSFEGPYFVKPRFGAASANIDESSIAQNWEQAVSKIKELQLLNIDIIVEKFINGIYYSVPIYYSDNKCIHLPAVQEESNLCGNVVTYRQKRKLDSGLIRTVNKDVELDKELIRESDKLLKVISPIDYTRMDFIVTETSIEFIEFNICCNLGKQSSFCISANYNGLSQKDLVTKIFINSLKRQNLF